MQEQPLRSPLNEDSWQQKVNRQSYQPAPQTVQQSHQHHQQPKVYPVDDPAILLRSIWVGNIAIGVTAEQVKPVLRLIAQICVEQNNTVGQQSFTV